jgi:two-component system response regulator
MNGMEEEIVLLVEDNPNDELLTVRAPKNNGVKSRVVVRDGVVALDYLFAEGSYAGQKTTAIPQIILLDLRLPKKDGLEVLRRLRADERTRPTPVVVFTSSKEKRDLIDNSGLQANGYVRKPVELEEFVEAVRQL